jgi:hypothetical protein
MRTVRSRRALIPVLATVVVALWAAAGIAWAGVLDEPDDWKPPVVVVHPSATGVGHAEVLALVERLTDDPRGWRTDLGHLTVQIVPVGMRGTRNMPGHIGMAWPGEQLAAVSDESWTYLGERLAAAGGTLDDQRTWVILHELGHLLGHGHQECGGSGPAPVMRATTYGIGDCALNVWPNP